MNPITFPIQRTVVYRGHDYIRTLNENDVVSCWCCGRPIVIDKQSVVNTEYDVPLVRCKNPECRKNVSVLYYFDRIVDNEALHRTVKKRKKKYSYEKTSDRPTYITVK